MPQWALNQLWRCKATEGHTQKHCASSLARKRCRTLREPRAPSSTTDIIQTAILYVLIVGLYGSMSITPSGEASSENNTLSRTSIPRACDISSIKSSPFRLNAIRLEILDMMALPSFSIANRARRVKQITWNGIASESSNAALNTLSVDSVVDTSYSPQLTGDEFF